MGVMGASIEGDQELSNFISIYGSGYFAKSSHIYAIPTAFICHIKAVHKDERGTRSIPFLVTTPVEMCVII